MKTSRMVVATAALALAGFAAPRDAAAQFASGQKYLGAHVGMSGVGSTAAVGVNGEIAYNEHIGLGAWADTWSYGQSFGTAVGGYDWNVRYVALAGTGSYHFPIKSSPKWDPFVGLALGYYVVSASYDGPGGSIDYGGDASRLFLGGFGGTRYFFKENLTGVARLGFGASYLSVGMDFKI